MTSTGSTGDTGFNPSAPLNPGTPLGAPGSTDQTVTFTFGPPPPPDELGPNPFYKNIEFSLDDPATEVNETPPRAWTEGGVIENVKKAVVASVREALEQTTLGVSYRDGLKFHVDIEYPTELNQYPGIWVQFDIVRLQRAGLGMSRAVKDDDGNWGEIYQWFFDGRITLTIAALSSKDRDRLSDAVIAQLAFSRTTDLTLRNPDIDTKQMRGLWDALLESPYIAISLGTDEIQSGGQTASQQVPWAPNALLYEDQYAITCQGQFNIHFRHDGVYELARINVNAESSGSGLDFTTTRTLTSATRQIGVTHSPPQGSGGLQI